MQPNKSKIALLVGAMYLGVSGASFAASESFTITATTIDDLELEEVTALDFGSNIFTSPGSCTMDADAPGDATLQLNGTATAAAVTYGTLEGDGCVNGDDLGTPGLYKVTASPGTAITITLSGVTQTDYTFEPAGTAGNYDNSTTDDLDTQVAIDTSSSTTVQTPTSDDDDTNVVANELMFTLGGTLTVLNDLTANSTVADTFTVTVVY